MKPIAGAALFLLAACSGQTTAQTVAQVEVALTAAEKAATIYVQLPLCSTTKSKVCSDAAVANKIKAADNVAFDAVQAARQSNDSAKTAAAAAAVKALTDIIPISVAVQ